jgi:hypothetical protein
VAQVRILIQFECPWGRQELAVTAVTGMKIRNTSTSFNVTYDIQEIICFSERLINLVYLTTRPAYLVRMHWKQRRNGSDLSIMQ